MTDTPKPFPQEKDRVRARDNYNGHWRRGTFKGHPMNPGDPYRVEWDNPVLGKTANLGTLERIPDGEDSEDFD